MFDYKNVSFYTSFFSSHPSFRIIEDFKESEEEDESVLPFGECIHLPAICLGYSRKQTVRTQGQER